MAAVAPLEMISVHSGDFRSSLLPQNRQSLRLNQAIPWPGLPVVP